jgi:threonine synthase
MSDAEYVDRVEALDEAVARVAGHGFRVTPFAPERELAGRIGLGPDAVWIKDETGNVAGSHKGRHLFGLALALDVTERSGRTSRAESTRRGLAIASCGNAALAAAVIARAAQRPLRVFIPEHADPRIVSRLGALSAEVVVCRREAGVPGDPCMHAFRAALKRGALPFCCQGSENGLTIDGGRTLAWEIAESLEQRGATLDRIFVQVGGGALASALTQGLRRAAGSERVRGMPRLHAVQTEGAWPLRRAWERLRDVLLAGADRGGRLPSSLAPSVADSEVAARIAALDPAARASVLTAARSQRGRFMWPWESTPESLAHGILDDETYDWAEVVLGMMESGGWPVTASEANVREAHTLARAATSIHADPTGTAGLAGLLELRATGAVGAGERVALLFTGVER